MKKLIFLFLVLALASACSSTKTTALRHIETTVDSDSLQHQIIIIDVAFEHWYSSHFSPAQDRSNEYYQSMNRLGTLNWNQYYNSGRYNRIINNYLNYETGTDYGIEVNRKLYWYFKYLESEFKIPLLR
jgi:hypothetical protein